MPRKVEDKEKKAAEIIRLIAEEGKSLRTAAEEVQIGHSTFLLWVNEDKALADQYARARDDRADAIFEEMFEIADDAQNDWMERQGENSEGWQLNGEHVQRSRLRIDTRKWALARMQPKKYGDKLDLNHGGQDGKPIEVINLMTVKPKTDET